LGLLKLRAPSDEAGKALSVALGCVGLEILLFLLGHTLGFRPGILLGLVLLGILALGRSEPFLGEGLSVWGTGSGWVAGLCLASFLLAGAAPATDWDALAYHLDIPKTYLAMGRMAPLPFSFNANMPHGCELLYVLPLSLAGAPAAQMLHGLFGLAACCMMPLLSERRSNPLALAAACSCPLFLTMASTANAELLLGLFFAGGLCASLSPRLKEARWALVAGLFAGACASVKYTGLWYAAAILLCSARRWGVRRLPLAIAAFAVPILPWLIRAACITGNPVFPVLNSVFPSELWSDVQSRQLHSLYGSIGMGRGLVDYLLIPYRLLRHARPDYAHFNGVISPLHLGLVPCAFLARDQARTRLLQALGLVALVWAASVQNLRYLAPLLPCIAWAGAAGLEAAGSGRLRTWASRAAVAVCCLLCAASWSQKGPALSAASGRVTAEEYVRASVPGASAIAFINRSLPENSQVLALWWNQAYGVDRTLWCDQVFEASWIFRMVHECPDSASLRQRWKELGATHLLLWNAAAGAFAPRPVPGYDQAAYQADLAKIGRLIEEGPPKVYSDEQGFEIYPL
jgi:hypothetical protein